MARPPWSANGFTRYGRTAVRPYRVAWLSLGASDSDVWRFFSYLIALTHDVSNVIAVQALGSTS
jgi:ATP/maltotriose-dependent transcriptional regulator MalT